MSQLENRISTRANKRGLKFRKRVDGVYDLIKGADLLVNGGTLEEVAACVSQFKTHPNELDVCRVRQFCGTRGYKVHRCGEDRYDLIKDGETVLSAATEEQIRAYLEAQASRSTEEPEVSRSTEIQLSGFEGETKKNRREDAQLRNQAAEVGLKLKKIRKLDIYNICGSDDEILVGNLTPREVMLWLGAMRFGRFK